MSYQDYRYSAMYDDFQSRQSSHRQTYPTSSPFQSRGHFQSDGIAYYPFPGSVSGTESAGRQSHLENDNSGLFWDGDGATNPYLRRHPAEHRRIAPPVELPHLSTPQANSSDWSGFSSPSIESSQFQLYSRISSGTNAFGGEGNIPRMTLAGSLDPSTGIFYRTPEHPRLRTAQACEKCRTRKAKCSGEHPSCKRCTARGLVCEYAKEGRVRGPNKPKIRQENSREELTKTSPQEETRDIPASDTILDVANTYSEGRYLRHRHSTSLAEHRASKLRPPNRSESPNLYLLQPAFRSGDHLLRKPLNSGQRKSRMHQQLTTTVPLDLHSRDSFNQPFSIPSATTHPSSPCGELVPKHGDSSRSSSSSLGDPYAGIPIVIYKQSTVSDQEACTRSDDGSTSKPTSAVSSVFDLPLATLEPLVHAPAISAIHDCPDAPGLYCPFNQPTPETTTPRQNGILSGNGYPESVLPFNGAPTSSI